MNDDFILGPACSLDELNDAIRVAYLATASLHPQANVPQAVECHFDLLRRQLHFNCDSPLGTDLKNIAVGLLQRAYGAKVLRTVTASTNREDNPPTDEGEYRTLRQWLESEGLDEDDLTDVLEAHHELEATTAMSYAHASKLLGMTFKPQVGEGEQR
jgi:hypothetical protein